MYIQYDTENKYKYLKDINMIFKIFILIIDGKLKKLNTETGLLINEGFEFNVSENPQYNQKRYEALGEVSCIDLFIY